MARSKYNVRMNVTSLLSQTELKKGIELSFLERGKTIKIERKRTRMIIITWFSYVPKYPVACIQNTNGVTLEIIKSYGFERGSYTHEFIGVKVTRWK